MEPQNCFLTIKLKLFENDDISLIKCTSLPLAKCVAFKVLWGKKMFHYVFVLECSTDYFLRKQGFQRPPVFVWVLPPAELKQDCRCPQWLATAVKWENLSFQLWDNLLASHSEWQSIIFCSAWSNHVISWEFNLVTMLTCLIISVTLEEALFTLYEFSPVVLGAF